MTISKDHVVYFHYTLTSDQGEKLDASGDEPLAYLHGYGQIISGLEKALEGKSTGDKLDVTVEPSEGYGEHQEELVQQVPTDMFEGVDHIEAGMQFQAQTEQGMQVVTVKSAKDGIVVVDANHPLAGQTLNFAVEVADVREATNEELAHGHAHGVGGYQH